jgi:uncharacterized protein YndB with AHSA1/START domain
MSVKKEPSGRRSVQVEVEVPGTPDAVWQAIATGPGVSAWFVPTEFGADGTIVSHFGPGMDASARLTAWQPPHRFAAEGRAADASGPPLQTEWLVESTERGTCVVRVIHGYFASNDDSDHQLLGVASRWPVFFRNLRLYLTHFGGLTGQCIQLLASAPAPASAAWERLTTALGTAGVSAGQRATADASLPSLAGIVEHARDGEPDLLLRLDRPTPGIAHFYALSIGAMVFVVIRFYLLGEDASAVAARDEARWRQWLGDLFPPPVTPTS